MLSRGNSEASARLRRAKSSASIKTRRSLSYEPPNSGHLAAKEHALAAASCAYGRATGSDLTSRASQDMATQSKTFDAERPLTRSRSIRFAGPTALPGRDLPITMRQAPPSQSDGEARRRSLYPDFRRNNSSIQGDDGFMTALSSHSEYLETYPASQPSSYRKLRKSKSMFSPRNLSAATSSTILQPTVSQTRGNVKPAVEAYGRARTHPGSRLGRSFSFLRPHDDYSPSTAVVGKAAQDEAIGLARDQYLLQLERQSIDGNPWVGNAAVRRHSQKTFRKTVRTASMNSRGSPSQVPTGSPIVKLERRGVGIKARNLSSSFKNRLKRVFNRSTEAEAKFPAQHLQATRLHFGDATPPFAVSESQGQSTQSLHHTLEENGQQREDILRIPRRQESFADDTYGEIDNLDTDDNKSRVTSWTSSTAANTLASHHDSGHKRLSIIQETVSAPLHPGSTRLRSLQSGAPLPGFQPRKISLYAKLQQRMSKNDSRARLRSSGADAGRTGTSSADDTEVSSASPHEAFDARRRRGSDQGRIDFSTSITPTQPSAPKAKDHSLAPQDLKIVQTDVQLQEVGDTSPKRPLRESKSAFFPQSTRIERSRTSPFRQAMQHNGLSAKTSLTNGLTTRPIRREEAAYLSASAETGEKSVARSESVYSRTSSGNSPQRYKSSKFPPGAESNDEDLAASVLLDGATERSGLPAEPTYGKPLVDSMGVDLRDWAPEKRLLLDPENSLHDRTGSVRRKRRIGHRKEHAQTSGEETDIGRLHLATRMPEASLNGSPTGLNVRASIRHASSQPMVDRFPLMTINTQANANYGERKFPTNSKTATVHTVESLNRQTPNRSDKSRENVPPRQSARSSPPPGKDTNAYSRQLGGGRHNRTGLHDDFQEGSFLAFSNPTSHSRSSPDRIARLRRMYSSHGLESPKFGKQTEPSPELHKNVFEEEKHDVWNVGLDGPKREGDSPGDELDLVPGSRKMVEEFLKKRRKSQGDDVEDMVFI